MHKDQNSQKLALQAILRQSPLIKTVLERTQQLDLPNWYLGAGCIAQTVWNHLHGYELVSNIKDLDLVYFESPDLSYARENQLIGSVTAFFHDIPLPIDVKNQARVHLWYEKHFGYPMQAYQSVEQAIATWPTTATCIGVAYDAQGFHVYAPYGLNDLFEMIIRPNKIQITEAIYQQKVTRWQACWPRLRIMAW